MILLFTCSAFGDEEGSSDSRESVEMRNQNAMKMSYGAN